VTLRGATVRAYLASLRDFDVTLVETLRLAPLLDAALLSVFEEPLDVAAG